MTFVIKVFPLMKFQILEKKNFAVRLRSCDGATIYCEIFNVGLFSQIILVQEKNIRRLNELVRHLQEQLQQCRSNNRTTNGTVSPLAERILELERQQILED